MMKGADYVLKLNELDADLIEGAAVRKKKRWNIGKMAGLIAACICLLAAGVFGSRALLKRGGEENEAGGTDGKLNVTSEIVLTGTEYELSLSEAVSYLESAKAGIINELTASGVHTGDFHFSPWGVSILRSGNKGNTMAVDWKQFLAYDGEKLIAIIDLCKDGSGVHHYVAFGGPWFESYDAMLKAHAGEELVMIYVGDVQAVVTPDNEVLSIVAVVEGTDSDGHFRESIEEGKDYYHYFKREQNTFIP